MTPKTWFFSEERDHSIQLHRTEPSAGAVPSLILSIKPMITKYFSQFTS